MAEKISIQAGEKPKQSTNLVEVVSGQVQQLSKDFGGVGGGSTDLSKLDSRYLRRDISNNAFQQITFDDAVVLRNGLQTEGFRQGIVMGTGASIYRDADQGTTLEIDNIVVRRNMLISEVIINQIKHNGGINTFSNANMVVSKIENAEVQDCLIQGVTKSYRCYFDTKGNTVYNQWAVGDIAFCQRVGYDSTESEPNITTKYYKKRVIGIGTDYIDLEPGGVGVGNIDSLIAINDNIVQFGHLWDYRRQSLMEIDVTHGCRQSMYQLMGNGLTKTNADGSYTDYESLNDVEKRAVWNNPLWSSMENKAIMDMGRVMTGMNDWKDMIRMYGSFYFGDNNTIASENKGYILWDDKSKKLVINGEVYIGGNVKIGKIGVGDVKLEEFLNTTYKDTVQLSQDVVVVGDKADAAENAAIDAAIDAKAASDKAKALEEELAKSDTKIAQIITDAANMQKQIDGAISTYADFYEPVLNKYPSNEWTTEDMKLQHQGDMFYNKSTGKGYRFFKAQDGVWAWELIADTDITAALKNATDALELGKRKRTIFVAEPTTVDPLTGFLYEQGDLLTPLFDTTIKGTIYKAGKIYRARQKNQTFVVGDWVESSYTDDTKANEAMAETVKLTNWASDVSSDNKLTPSEKQEARKQLDAIIAERPYIVTNAIEVNVTTSDYANKYNALYDYLTPLLVDLSTTSDIMGDEYRTYFRNYAIYKENVILGIAKHSRMKSIADGWANGKLLFDNPAFVGSNIVSIYTPGDNGLNGTITVKQSDGNNANPINNSKTNPNNRILEIVTTSNSNISSYLHYRVGFYFSVISRANALYVTRIIAKIPVGYNINFTSNPVGEGGELQMDWVTNCQGTGDYKEYLHYLKAGNSGSFSSTGFYFIAANNGNPPLQEGTWWVAYANISDLTNVENASTIAEKAKGDAAAAQIAASTAQTAINAMDNNSVFDTSEKQSIRTQWEAIHGVADTTSNAGSNGSYSKAVTASAANSVSSVTLTNMYDALKTYLNTWQLYVNTNSAANFVRTTMATNFTNYYNEEVVVYDKISKGYVDKLEIGGVNLLDGSKMNSLGGWNANSVGNSGIVLDNGEYVYSFSTTTTGGFWKSLVCKSGPKTMSFEAKRIGSSVYSCFISFGEGPYLKTWNFNGDPINKWVTKSYSINPEITSAAVVLYAGNYDKDGLLLRNIKIEYGNKATAWTPSLYDQQEANRRLKSMADDNVITSEEKAQLRNDYEQIKKNYTSLSSLASAAGVETTNLYTAYTDINTLFGSSFVNIASATDFTFTDTLTRDIYNTRISKWEYETGRISDAISDINAERKAKLAVDGIPKYGLLSYYPLEKDFEELNGLGNTQNLNGGSFINNKEVGSIASFSSSEYYGGLFGRIQSTSFTITFTFQDSLNYEEKVIDFRNLGGNYLLLFGDFSGKMHFIYRYNNVDKYLIYPAKNDNKYYTVSITVNASTKVMTMFLNGSEITNNTLTNIISTSMLKNMNCGINCSFDVSRGWVSSGNPLSVGRVSIHNRVLSDSEIEQASRKTLSYLQKSFQQAQLGDTSIEGGLILSNVIGLKDASGKVRTIISGNEDNMAFVSGIKDDGTLNTASTVIYKDGSGSFMDGLLSWGKRGAEAFMDLVGSLSSKNVDAAGFHVEDNRIFSDDNRLTIRRGNLRNFREIQPAQYISAYSTSIYDGENNTAGNSYRVRQLSSISTYNIPSGILKEVPFKFRNFRYTYFPPALPGQMAGGYTRPVMRAKLTAYTEGWQWSKTVEVNLSNGTGTAIIPFQLNMTHYLQVELFGIEGAVSGTITADPIGGAAVTEIADNGIAIMLNGTKYLYTRITPNGYSTFQYSDGKNSILIDESTNKVDLQINGVYKNLYYDANGFLKGR